MKTKNLRQSVLLHAKPHEVYEMLMDSKKHSRLTNSKAHMSRKVKGKFSVWGGDIHGFNEELVKDKLIVQEWRTMDWPKEHFSKARFKLDKVKGGTRLTFTQSGIPERDFELIKDGWKMNYWQPMKEMVAMS